MSSVEVLLFADYLPLRHYPSWAMIWWAGSSYEAALMSGGDPVRTKRKPQSNQNQLSPTVLVFLKIKY